MPTTLIEIGLEDVSDEESLVVAERACPEGESIYNEPIPAAPQMVFAALKAAEGINGR